MPSLKHYARRAADRTFGTAFDRALARARAEGHDRFLFYWNRGLGDIALGLVPLFLRIRREIPAARIEVLTRPELMPAFTLAGVDATHALPDLPRESRVDLAKAFATLGLDRTAFRTVFEYPDPNRWLDGRRHEYPPTLSWNAAWDIDASSLVPTREGEILIGAHVHSETARYYGYRKDWPPECWQALMARLSTKQGVHWILLGNDRQTRFVGDNITDLRGKTSFPQLMAVVRNRCRVLVAPDSGILTMAYYLDAPFPIEIVSLWADPRQGVLLQGCASPNPLLHHVPLVSPGEDITRLPVEAVERAVRAAVAVARGS